MSHRCAAESDLRTVNLKFSTAGPPFFFSRLSLMHNHVMQVYSTDPETHIVEKYLVISHAKTTTILVLRDSQRTVWVTGNE